jgi:16S rRNA processing protein RimM
VIVGEITRPHGLRGAVRVLPLTDFPDHLLSLRKVVLMDGGGPRTVAVESAQPAGRGVVMKLAGVDSIEAADALRGATLRIAASEVRPLPPGEFYVFQIVGLRVRTPDGQSMGEVVDVLRTGSNDVYVVRSADGRDTLLPAVEGVIETIDVAAGQIVARPPEWM